MDNKISKIRKEKLNSNNLIRIFGIPIEGVEELKQYKCILYCGLKTDTIEIKQYSNRIWYIPSEKIKFSGIDPDFKHEEKEVNWFDLDKDTSPIEELYVNISLGKEILKTIDGRIENRSKIPNLFAAVVGDKLPTYQFMEEGQNNESVSHKVTLVRNKIAIGNGRFNELLAYCNQITAEGTGFCLSTPTQVTSGGSYTLGGTYRNTPLHYPRANNDEESDTEIVEEI